MRQQKSFLIVGLGNIGLEYQHTYHNMGFWAIDQFAEQYNIKIDKKECDAYVGVGSIEGIRVILAKPTTYMNLSGLSTRQLIKKYQLDTTNALIIYDDIDLDIGITRYRKDGSAGTHNGMKSVIKELDTQNIPRLRIGVGKPPPTIPLFDFVTMKVSQQDTKILQNTMQEVSKILTTTIQQIANNCA